MYTFNDFIEAKSQEQVTENQLVQAFNVMVLYKQYIEWVLEQQQAKKEKHQMKVADLLLQLHIINAYQIHYVGKQDNATWQAMPEEIRSHKMEDRSQKIKMILSHVKKRAIDIFELNEAKKLARNEMIAICASIILGTLLAVLHPQVDAYLGAYLASATFLALTVINICASIVSGIMPNEKTLSKVYDTAVKLTHPRVEMIKLYLNTHSDNGYNEAVTITSNAILTAWKDSFVHRSELSECLDLKQVNEQIDLNIKQRMR